LARPTVARDHKAVTFLVHLSRALVVWQAGEELMDGLRYGLSERRVRSRVNSETALGLDDNGPVSIGENADVIDLEPGLATDSHETSAVDEPWRRLVSQEHRCQPSCDASLVSYAAGCTGSTGGCAPATTVSLCRHTTQNTAILVRNYTTVTLLAEPVVRGSNPDLAV
jgi:hypothetical protein